MVEVMPLLARMKLRQTRGASYFQVVVNLGVITANIRLFVPDAGIPVYLLAAALWVVATVGIGYLDEFYGIWKAELAYGSSAVNPFFTDMARRIERIEREVAREEE